MYGQLNLFAFVPVVEVYYPTPRWLNNKLWSVIKRTDDRGYSFGEFNRFGDNELNYDCLTIVLFRDNEPIGFITVSLRFDRHRVRDDEGNYLEPNFEPLRLERAWIDVWVMPRYRDMRLGSLLINRADVESLKLFGRVADYNKKHQSHCWDARFRKQLRETQAAMEWKQYSYVRSKLDWEQLPLLSETNDEAVCERNRICSRILLSSLGGRADIGYEAMRLCKRALLN